MPRMRKPCSFPECDEQWTTLRCARCRLAHYCCSEHQKKHWKSHKEACEEVGGQGVWLDEGTRKEAPEVGRKPFIWEFRPIPNWSPQYNPDTPEKIGYDWRGEQRCLKEQEEAQKETRQFHWKSTTEGLDQKHRELRQNCAWLHRRLQLMKMLLEQLKDEEGGEKLALVQPEHVASLQNQEKESFTQLGGAWGQAGPNQMLHLSGYVDMDLGDLEGLSYAALQQRLGEMTRMHAQAVAAEKSMSEDKSDRKHWDRIESGHETRDMLENGIRRAHMEARLGRIATR